MASDASVKVAGASRFGTPAVSDANAGVRWLLATLSFAAGAIHLVMVPQHAQESMRMGLAFAAAGWVQIAFGVAVLATPRRLWLWLAVPANLLFLAMWTISRTVGLPDWTGGGGTEPAQSVDILCVVFEVAIVVGAFMLLVAPTTLERWKTPARAVAVLASVAAIVGTTAVLASPSTATHVHGADDEHAHDDADAHAAGHGHDEAAAGHHHAESTTSYAELPEETKSEVDRVIARWADRYPTAADAASAGWFKSTPSLYGIGAHYIQTAAFTGAAEFELMNPNILLYDGEGPDAKFAGVSYVLAEKPTGFAGNYDSWHSHKSVCMEGPGVLSLTEPNSDVWLSESECTARGGRVMPLDNDQMMHLWIGPGYIDGAPIFAHDHPKLFDGYNPKQQA